MGRWRFRRSIKIAPGLRINLGSKSVGISAGIRGIRLGVNTKNGLYSHLSIPGTGLYRRDYHSKSKEQLTIGDSRANANPEIQAISGIFPWRIGMYFLLILGVVLFLAPSVPSSAKIIAAVILGIMIMARHKSQTSNIADKSNDSRSILGKNSSPPMKETQRYTCTFANLRWGMSLDDVRAILAKRGYTEVNTEDDAKTYTGESIYSFRGMVGSCNANIHISFNSHGKLVKTGVFITVKSNKIFSKYDELREALVKKHGEPMRTFEAEEPPFSRQTGRTAEALRNGKVEMETYWGIETEWWMSIVVRPDLTIITDFIIIIVYLGPDSDEDAKRTAEASIVDL